MTQTAIKNTIKVINIEELSEILYNNTLLLDLYELEIYEKCANMADQQDFRNLFFFIDENSEMYFYQRQHEQEIKNYIFKQFNISEIDERAFSMYSNYLYGCSDIQSIHLGNITIEQIDFYIELEDSFMTNDTIISKLVFAGRKNRFYWEMDNVKKLCLIKSLKKKYEDALLEVNDYEFEG